MRKTRRGFVSGTLTVFLVLLVVVSHFFFHSADARRKEGVKENDTNEVLADVIVHDTHEMDRVNRSMPSFVNADDESEVKDMLLFPSLEDRHLNYAGSWHNFTLSERDISNARHELCVIRRNGHTAQYLKTDTLHLVTRSDLESCDQSSRVPALKHGKYCKDALSFFDTGVQVEHVLVTFGDVTPNSSLPFITKSRPQTLSHRGILWPLNVDRHFARLDSVDSLDTPWEQKRPRLVWRGADTGRGERTKLVRKFFSDRSEDVDIALTLVLEYGDAAIRRPALGMEALLRNKYLLSLEGNDVSSGLKWMLLSKSVVFMPAPTYVSWALETRLRPFVHYIPVQPDLSDMRERLEWAKGNDRACIGISARATEFMSNFLGYAERNNSRVDAGVKQLLVQNFNDAMSRILGDFQLESCDQNHTSAHSA